MTALSAGVLGASSAFRATGGDMVVDANGYRHHIFNSSGLLLVSREKELFFIVQDGGFDASPGFRSGAFLVGASGGNAGLTRYFSATASQNISIEVGSARVQSSVSTSPLPLTLSLIASYSSNGGTNPGLRYNTETSPTQWTTSGAANPTNPVSKPTHSSVRSFWLNVPGLPAQGGGGGGQGVVRGLSNGGGTFNITKGGGGGVAGGGVGATFGSGYTLPTSGLANTGGGGGGGATEAAGNSNLNFANAGGLGSSGYVVVSYAL